MPWTNNTRFPVGTSAVLFEAEDMSGHVAGTELAGDVGTCSVAVTVLDICAELGDYCGENGVCQPDTGACACKVDLQVEKEVCGGGTACDGAGAFPSPEPAVPLLLHRHAQETVFSGQVMAPVIVTRAKVAWTDLLCGPGQGVKSTRLGT